MYDFIYVYTVKKIKQIYNFYGQRILRFDVFDIINALI